MCRQQRNRKSKKPQALGSSLFPFQFLVPYYSIFTSLLLLLLLLLLSRFSRVRLCVTP